MDLNLIYKKLYGHLLQNTMPKGRFSSSPCYGYWYVMWKWVDFIFHVRKCSIFSVELKVLEGTYSERMDSYQPLLQSPPWFLVTTFFWNTIFTKGIYPWELWLHVLYLIRLCQSHLKSVTIHDLYPHSQESIRNVVRQHDKHCVVFGYPTVATGLNAIPKWWITQPL